MFLLEAIFGSVGVYSRIAKEPGAPPFVIFEGWEPRTMEPPDVHSIADKRHKLL
jgi:hypothetical protein